MFALIDCNNFFASCERVFRPDLQDKPIIVLSNNDGCVIARSNEAKALGIKMGEPYFKIKALCLQYHVVVFSSNYCLYGDLSFRVMSVIANHWPEVELYSIDEAFLHLRHMPASHIESFCTNIQRVILKETGIPTSIGIGCTKTLAKVANHMAKKVFSIPVFNLLTDTQHWLKQIPVAEVWGIGSKWSAKLRSHQIISAADLANSNLAWLRETFQVMLVRTAMELNGVTCHDLQINEKRKSLVSSRSFGHLQTEYAALAQAISSHCHLAYEKLRTQNQLADHLGVFVHSNRFRRDLPQYHNAIDIRLPHPTDDLRYLTKMAKFCLKKLFKPGIQYQKVGIYMGHLSDKTVTQNVLPLWDKPAPAQHNEPLLLALDHINRKFGRGTLRLAAEGFDKPWHMKQNLRSPNYTTQWLELPTVKLINRCTT